MQISSILPEKPEEENSEGQEEETEETVDEFENFASDFSFSLHQKTKFSFRKFRSQKSNLSASLNAHDVVKLFHVESETFVHFEHQ